MKLISIAFVIFSFILTPLFAQEYIEGLPQNKIVSSYYKNNQSYFDKKNQPKANIEIPFWDDFSTSEIYPNPLIWETYDAYINSTLVEYPPSIGIATLDAVDAKGAIYEFAGYENPFIADYLRSRPINLNYPGNETIWLSFFIQPQGIVDAPEENDSLILEFYAPSEKKWYRAWDTTGYQNNGHFDLIMIPINNEKFLKDSFQFQFYNYASLGSSTYPSLAVNSDFWHIDYVYLNKNRTANDTVFRDIAFNTPLSSLLNNYESVPWQHFKSTSEVELSDVIEVKYRNNGNTIGVIDSLNFTLTDLSGNSPVQYGFGGNNIINPFYQYTFLYNNQPFIFPDNSEDFCDFRLKVKLVTTTTDSSQNNSILYTQKFRDYYAYDDGSAESGYGITGNGSRFGSVAYYFDPLQPDYLRGVYLYFTQAYNDASQKYFWLNVWSKGEDNLPDTLIISMEGQLPEYSNTLNEFIYYEFDEPVFLSDPFYIGWTQTTEDKLNIGFDLNKTANDKLYYNIFGSWVQSSIQGAVMIRPQMGIQVTNIDDQKISEIKFYPNPTKDILFFEPNTSINQFTRLQIFDLQGKLLIERTITDQIDVSILPDGIYVIRCFNPNGFLFTSKFIKQ